MSYFRLTKSTNFREIWKEFFFSAYGVLLFVGHGDEEQNSQKYIRNRVLLPNHPVLVVVSVGSREFVSTFQYTAVPFSTFGLSVRLAGCSDSITFDARNTMNSSSTKMPPVFSCSDGRLV